MKFRYIKLSLLYSEKYCRCIALFNLSFLREVFLSYQF